MSEMNRREMLGMVVKAAAVGSAVAVAGELVGCVLAPDAPFEDAGPELVGDGQGLTVYALTEQHIGVIRIVPRTHAGYGASGDEGGPLVVEIAGWAPGEWIYLVDDEMTSVGAHRYVLQPGQRLQWRRRPFADGQEPLEQHMPEADWQQLRAIGARNYA